MVDEKQGLVSELKDLYKKLKSYNRYLLSQSLSESQKRYRESLREGLVRKSAALKDKIIELTGTQYIRRGEKRFDIWKEAFNTVALSEDRASLTFCINATNEAIGKLESDIEAGVRDEQGNLLKGQSTGEITSRELESPTDLFDAMQFHANVVEASRDLFKNEHYSQAIFEAFKAVENFVQKRAGSALYGKHLMATVFNEENPIIQVPEAGIFDKDVQEGFKFLFMGASQGIRNPKAHKKVIQNDPYITLEYLGFASFLLKRISYWGVGKY